MPEARPEYVALKMTMTPVSTPIQGRPKDKGIFGK